MEIQQKLRTNRGRTKSSLAGPYGQEVQPLSTARVPPPDTVALAAEREKLSGGKAE